MRKNILLTFDFELFLGQKSGSVENCLIKPTEELIPVINRYNLSTIFFVDTLYLYRLKKQAEATAAAKKDFVKIINLLRRLITSTKAYVFHHIHPHWLDAIYIEKDNEWDGSNKSRFALSNLNEGEVEAVFEKSNTIINEIYMNLTSPFAQGYRAGGLYAQPFEGFKSQLDKYGIKLDFSVLKDAVSTEEGYKFNYSSYPVEDIYKFSNDIVEKDVLGNFIEISMNQFHLSGINKLINGLYYRTNLKSTSWKRWGDGSSSGNVVGNTKKANKFKSTETYSIELLNKFKVNLYTKELKKKDFIHIISHPKFFSKQHIDSFEKMIETISNKYELETNLFQILNNSNISIK